MKIDECLKKNELPTVATNSSERSYELVKDEKGGKALLERIDLIDKLKIIKTPDPLKSLLSSVLLPKRGKSFVCKVVNDFGHFSWRFIHSIIQPSFNNVNASTHDKDTYIF